jgi:S-adenosylmethionine hydrolase
MNRARSPSRRSTRLGLWITLLTDFGMRDGWVAAMKGVIATLAPSARVIDAGHEIAPGDVFAAAWALWQYWFLWPRGTIHVIVVDPGVGSSRAALLAQAEGRWFLAPDNGTLSAVAAECTSLRAWRLRPDAHRPEGCSNTFHGRDVFAWVAGRLAAGARPAEFIADPHPVRPWPSWHPVRRSNEVIGQVLHIDRFGNAITNLQPHDLPPTGWELRCGPLRVRTLVRTYSEVAPGRPLLYLGSAGRLEIGVRNGSAAERYSIRRGQIIRVHHDPRPTKRIAP